MSDTLQDKLNKARHLSYAERRVLELRYGLDEGVPRTLAEVAQMLDLSRERVRQMEHLAFKKLGVRTSSPANDD